MIFHNEVIGYNHGQMDQILFCEIDGKVVGRIDYSVYDNEPAVKMISVFDKRKGYGKAMVLELQSMFPDTEIDMGMGMLTDEGSALLKSIPQKIIPNPDYIILKNRLKILTKLEERLKFLADNLSNASKEQHGRISKMIEKMNDISSEVWNVENKMNGMKPTTRIFINLVR